MIADVRVSCADLLSVDTASTAAFIPMTHGGVVVLTTDVKMDEATTARSRVCVRPQSVDDGFKRVREFRSDFCELLHRARVGGPARDERGEESHGQQCGQQNLLGVHGED